jgi:hypothetical protein
MMSLSPPGYQPVTREGGRTLTPREGHGLLRAACLPVPPPGHSRTVDRGGSRTLICRVQAGRLPVGRHAHSFRHRASDLGGSRTHNALIKSQVLCRLSYKAIEAVARVGVEPTDASPSSWPLCRFAYHAIGQYDVRGSNPPGPSENQATSPEVERRIGQSARRESNPPWTVWKTAAFPLGYGHILCQSSGRRGI